MIWNPQRECMSPEQTREIQQKNLSAVIDRVLQSVPFYQHRLNALGIRSGRDVSLEDLSKIPFTTKDDLRDHYPYGLFAVPMRDVVRIHASSGTTGKPTVVGYTRNDLDMWSEVVARIACLGGATPDSIVQIAFGYGLFTGAFGLHYGMEKLGAAVIPVSSGNTEKQIQIMRDFCATVLICTPSYALYMAEVAQRLGEDPTALPLRFGLFGGEGSTQEMREELERRWGIQATENYGLSEIIGPGVCGECEYQNGMHIAQDHFLIEIIDPDTGLVLPVGERGEVVITTLTKEALPLLRYRTRDISWLIPEPCACGRTSLRLAKIQGRSDDMLIIRGVNVFPSQIESVLMGIEGIGPHYEIVVTREGFLDKLEILIELSDASLLDSFGALDRLEKDVVGKLRAVLSIDAKIKLVEPETLKRFEGKAKRVRDLR